MQIRHREHRRRFEPDRPARIEAHAAGKVNDGTRIEGGGRGLRQAVSFCGTSSLEGPFAMKNCESQSSNAAEK
jgi:hypothetical protein